jgi:hypothetical protein
VSAQETDHDQAQEHAQAYEHEHEHAKDLRKNGRTENDDTPARPPAPPWGAVLASTHDAPRENQGSLLAGAAVL